MPLATILTTVLVIFLVLDLNALLILLLWVLRTILLYGLMAVFLKSGVVACRPGDPADGPAR